MKPEAGSPNPSISHPDALQKIMAEVVQNRLCTHCGTCVGLAPDVLEMQLTDHGPVPAFLPGAGDASLETAYAACPGKGMDYPGLNEFVFGKSPSNWLVGCYRAFYIGYSNAPAVRRQIGARNLACGRDFQRHRDARRKVDKPGKFDILLVRCREGIVFPDTPQPVHTMFVLVGSRDEQCALYAFHANHALQPGLEVPVKRVVALLRTDCPLLC